MEMYERRFFQLKKFSGWNEGDKPLVQHFIRGLNPRIGEEVRTFRPKTMKEAADQAKLDEMKSVFSSKNVVVSTVPHSGKNQKTFKTESKAASSGFSNKSQKRKFNRFSNSNIKGFKVPDIPKTAKPAESVKQSFAPANSSQEKSTKRGAECWHCGKLGHFQWNCPLKGNNQSKPRSSGSEATVGDSRRNHHIFTTVDHNQEEHQNMIIEAKGTFQGTTISILFDSGATDSFISANLVKKCKIPVRKAEKSWQVELAFSSKVESSLIVADGEIRFTEFTTLVNLMVISLGTYDIILGMDWLNQHQAVIDCSTKEIQCLDDFGSRNYISGIKRPISVRTISAK